MQQASQLEPLLELTPDAALALLRNAIPLTPEVDHNTNNADALPSIDMHDKDVVNQRVKTMNHQLTSATWEAFSTFLQVMHRSIDH